MSTEPIVQSLGRLAILSWDGHVWITRILHWFSAETLPPPAKINQNGRAVPARVCCVQKLFTSDNVILFTVFLYDVPHKAE